MITPRQIVREIISEVAERHGVTLGQIMSPIRTKKIAHARQEAQAALYDTLNDDGTRRYSLPKIGRIFDRDHTSVLHAIRRVRERAEAGQ